MPVTLRNLSYFLALTEERHFGRAADRAHVSQPALSMQIKELEESLGTPLVERLTRDLRLTAAGREVELRARRILAEVAALEQSARHQAVAGRINLGVIPTLAPYLLPAMLPLLRAAHVTRELRLREAQTEVLLAELERGHLDAVVIAEPQDRAGLSLRPLFEDRFLLAGHATRLGRLPETESLRPVALDPISCCCWTKAIALPIRRWRSAACRAARRGWTWGPRHCPRFAGWSGRGWG